MKKTRISLFYLAGYLIPTGIGLLFTASITLKLLMSNGDYGDMFPRIVGMLLIGIGIIAVQLIRLKNYILYPTTIFVRIFFCICFVFFYFINRDPLFLVMLGVVAIGLVLTSVCYLSDSKQKKGGIINERRKK